MQQRQRIKTVERFAQHEHAVLVTPPAPHLHAPLRFVPHRFFAPRRAAPVSRLARRRPPALIWVGGAARPRAGGDRCGSPWHRRQGRGPHHPLPDHKVDGHVRHRLCLVFPLHSWPRHRLCLVFPLPSWLRHRLCLVFPLPSWPMPASALRSNSIHGIRLQTDAFALRCRRYVHRCGRTARAGATGARPETPKPTCLGVLRELV